MDIHDAMNSDSLSGGNDVFDYSETQITIRVTNCPTDSLGILKDNYFRFKFGANLRNLLTSSRFA